MWVMFHVACPTPDGQTGEDLYQERVIGITTEMQASAREHGWEIEDEPGEVAISLEGVVGLVPLAEA